MARVAKLSSVLSPARYWLRISLALASASAQASSEMVVSPVVEPSTGVLSGVMRIWRTSTVWVSLVRPFSA